MIIAFFILIVCLSCQVTGNINNDEIQTFRMTGLGVCRSTSVNGCRCKEQFEIGGYQFSNCVNPSHPRSKLPWCFVDSSCENYRGIIEGDKFDYCTSDCTSSFSQEQGDTIKGCTCEENWEYDGKQYSGCHNPDNDLLGNWCVVNTLSCVSQSDMDIIFQGTYGLNKFYDYCRDPGYSLSQGDEAIQEESGLLECVSVLTWLNETGEDFSTLNDIILEASMQDEIDGFSEFTLFAPNNYAMNVFANNQNIDVSDFFLFKSNIAALREVVKLHFVKQVLGSNILQDSQGVQYPTQLENQMVTITANGTQVLVASDAEGQDEGVIQNLDSPIEVCGGLVFTIDVVLVPVVQI
eukprot:TRINITY_DN36202_c0_g1_i1.p1 TRINITY_DN36202_c0_g1~~TRINITY_DN36202_c0_g1_i1.p1  ORF type:complete len:350 (-),score=24.62 TRINITY_DN36202_c0_g1_i1:116-1165(-)